MTQTVSDSEITYCERHPDRETTLRCNKCDRYMCVQCAVQTPVGYRCRDCVRELEDKYFNATSRDDVVAAVICLVLGLVGGFIADRVGFLLIIIILAAPVGGVIAEVALRAVQRRRGRNTPMIAAAATAIGALFPILWILITVGVLLPRIDVLVFAGIAAAAVYGRFRMRG